MKQIDLNCDLGEATDTEQERLESLVFPFVTSVNVACGQHAGNPGLMRRTVQRAKASRVSVGAHPGFPDREHKGRRDPGLPLAQVEALVIAQIEALAAIAEQEGERITHMKPHGAMYGRAARDPWFAERLVRAVLAVDQRLTVVGLAGAHLTRIARAQGLRVAEETFVDRAYEADGHLASREMADAVLTDPGEVADRLERLVREGMIPSRTGAAVRLNPDTICVHGDTPGADRLLAVIRTTLERLGVAVVSYYAHPRDSSAP